MLRPNNKKIKYLSIITLLFFLILNSCSDENKYDFSSHENKEKSANIKEIKNWYNQLGIEKRMYDTLADNLIATYNPEWDKAKFSEVNDSTFHTLVPLIILAKQGENELIGATLKSKSFLLVKNNNDFYFANFFPLENDKQSLEDNFLKNGTLVLIDIISRHEFTYLYKDGIAEYQNPKIENKSLKKASDPDYIRVRSCTIKSVCLWYTVCSDMTLTLAPSFTGCNPPFGVPVCDDGGTPGEWFQRKPGSNTIACEDVLYPVPPLPENLYNPDIVVDRDWDRGNPLERLASLFRKDGEIKFPVNPCDAVIKANQIASNAGLKTLINDIKNKTLENGAYIYLNSENNMDSRKLGVPYSSGLESKLKIAYPSWNETQGYSIGFIHNHPNGGAPSPSDIFVPAQRIVGLATVDSKFSDQQIIDYIRNYSSIIVSGEYVYTVTIKDPFFFALAQDVFVEQREPEIMEKKRKVENARFTKKIEKYLTNTDGTKEDVQKAGDAALLELYGKIINISKQKIGDTNQNKALVVNNGKVTALDC